MLVNILLQGWSRQTSEVLQHLLPVDGALAMRDEDRSGSSDILALAAHEDCVVEGGCRRPSHRNRLLNAHSCFAFRTTLGSTSTATARRRLQLNVEVLVTYMFPIFQAQQKRCTCVRKDVTLDTRPSEIPPSRVPRR